MPNYWLLKSEPDAYSIDDLARDTREPWTGVRNYQARNFMRDTMKVGDIALYYHSSTTPPGVVGIANVISNPHADQTAFDPKSEYFDPKSSPDNPTWVCVDIGFVEKFPRMVTLDEIKQDSTLEGILVAKRGMRLSIQPLSEAHFSHITSLAHQHI